MSILIPEVKVIRLYGVLGEKFGRVHSLAVASPIEALKALSVIIPGFQLFMLESKSRGLTFAVFEGRRNLGKDDLPLQSNGSDIRIAPVIIGSKRAGLFQTILGAVLITAAAFAAGGIGAAFAAKGWTAFAAMSGASMMLGGVVQMLSPCKAVWHHGKTRIINLPTPLAARLILLLRVIQFRSCMGSAALVAPLSPQASMRKTSSNTAH